MAGQMERCLDFGRECAQLLRSSRRYDHLIPRLTPERAVSEFIESKDRGYLVIVGEPGIGKTGFLMNLCSKATISYFFQERTWSARILNFLNYLAAELDLRLGENTALPSWLDDPDEAHIRTNSLLSRVGQNLAQGEKLLIMVDALDEADLGDDENARLLKFDLPRGLYFICTSRPEPRILGQLEGHFDISSIFNWRKDGCTIAEVNNYINDCLPEASDVPVQSKVKTSAHGLILIASHLLRTLERGAISLTEIPTRIRTIDAFFEDDWNNRVLKQARTADLCEDVATLLAASQEPLSASIIARATWHHKAAKSKMRDIKQSLIDIETFLEPIEQGHVNRWRPFHPSFGRWLEEFYKEDLCEAHRALAMAFTEIIKDPTNPDVGCAARCVCRHLREWAKRTADGSQKSEVYEILRKLGSDMKLRRELEYRYGMDVYLECILYERVKYAEEAGSLPNMIRFGADYINYQATLHTYVDYLKELLRQNRFAEAMRIAEVLPGEDVVLASLATIGCQAADANYRGVLATVLEHISANYREEGFKGFAAVAWSLMGRLINLEEEELISRFISTISDEEFNRSAGNYLRKTLQTWSASHLSLNTVTLLLNKAARCDVTNLHTHVQTIAEIAFNSGLSDSNVAECLLSVLHSVENTRARLEMSDVLSGVLIEHHLSSYAKQAVGVFLEDFAYSDSVAFIIGLDRITDTIYRLEDKSDAITLYERLLSRIVEGYNKRFDLCKAEALVNVGYRACELLPSEDVAVLEQRIRWGITRLKYGLLKDYVHIQLVALSVQHKLYVEAVSEIDSIRDPLCKDWARAVVIGDVLVEGGRLPLVVAQKLVMESSDTCSLNARHLVDLARRIVNFAAESVCEPISVGTGVRGSGQVGYPHMSTGALVDIVAALNEIPTATQAYADILGELLRKSVCLLSSMGSKSEWFSYHMLCCLLEVTEQIVQQEARQKVLSEMLIGATRMEPGLRLTFLANLAEAMERTNDKANLAKLIEVLLQLRWQDVRFDAVVRILHVVHRAMGPTQICRVINHFVDRMPTSERLRIERETDCVEFICSIPKILDPERARNILERIGDIFAKDAGSLHFPQAAIAIADCYEQLNLSVEAEGWRYERLGNASAICQHLGFSRECKGQITRGRDFFIEALKFRRKSYTDVFCSDVHGSLAIAFAKTGNLSLAFKDLRNVRAHTHAVLRPRLAVLDTILSEFGVDPSQVDEILGELTGPDLLVGLGAKLEFFKTRGRDKEAKETLKNLLVAMNKEVKAAEGTFSVHLIDTILSLRDVLIKAGNDQELQNWLDTIVALHNEFKRPYILDGVAKGISPCVAKEKPWLVSRLIDILPGYKSEGKYTSAPCCVAKIISLVEDEELCVKYWEQFIAALSQMDFTSPERMGKSLSTYLARSVADASKMRLLGKLCAALVRALPSTPPRSELLETMTEIVHTVVEDNLFEDKRNALQEILTALPLSSENPWLPALVAEGLAFLGDKDEAGLLFKQAMELSDEVEEDFIREAEKSRIVLIMAKCGFTKEVLPLLKAFGTKEGLYADEVDKNIALGFLHCNDRDSAMSVASGATNGEAKVEVAAGLFAQSVQEFGRLVGSADSIQTDINDNKATKTKDSVLGAMEKCLGMISGANRTPIRDRWLTKIANEILNLPSDEAMKWLAKLPAFSEDYKVWDAFCASHNYDPEIVRKFLITVPKTKSKRHFLLHLSSLGNELVSERLRLSLCAQAVHWGYFFSFVAYNCLRECRDTQVLEEVRQVVQGLEESHITVAESKRRPVSARTATLMTDDIEEPQQVKGRATAVSKPPTEIASHAGEVEMPEHEQQKELERLWEVIKDPKKVQRTDSFHKIVGKSEAIRDVLTLIEKVKDTDVTVLITGETGTGKELVARAIHDGSHKRGAFVPINVTALPGNLMEAELFGYKKGAFTDAKEARAGMFKTADKGTIFLDEIGDMNIACQAKLLRVLQEREIQPIGETKPFPIDVRVIAATNKDLEKVVREGKFREDLYYRIAVFRIHVPALRERKEDIPELAEHFVGRLASRVGRRKKSISKDAMEKMLLHDWPGNIRVLQNCMENAFVLAESDVIEANHIKLLPLPLETESQSLGETERQRIISVLRRSKTFAEAARRLKLTRQSLDRRCKKHNMNYKDYLGSGL